MSSHQIGSPGTVRGAVTLACWGLLGALALVLAAAVTSLAWSVHPVLALACGTLVTLLLSAAALPGPRR